MASSGSPDRRVNSRRPRSVTVTAWVVSRAGISISPAAAACENPISPPPQVL
jgi:hypothetical protein